ncbi:MAG: DUF3795 domain-containing protein [Dehalococcoidia bacterium]|nr:DUF3795 domain-containing protein [Dehalococcoidia bacterium]
MSEKAVRYKVYPTIGACGIDCGLCPRYNSKAVSRCPGCAPVGFLDAGGQWCKMTRCAVRDRGYETCAECAEFPCHRFEGWDQGDSFVSHLKSIANLHAIKERGLDGFLEQQSRRIGLLEAMLGEFDEGRSKSYCCVAAALLPLEELVDGVEKARREVVERGIGEDDKKSRAKILRGVLDSVAERLNVSLRLRTGGKK